MEVFGKFRRKPSLLELFYYELVALNSQPGTYHKRSLERIFYEILADPVNNFMETLKQPVKGVVRKRCSENMQQV